MKQQVPETVVIIGASEKTNRYSHMAMTALSEHGHDVRLVNPFKTSIDGQRCFRSIADINDEINTVTLYVNPERFKDHIDEVVKARPDRVIMNPGTENSEMEKVMKEAGIEVLRACTLIMLSSGSF